MEEKLSFRCANCGETVEFQIPSNWRDAEVKDLDGRPKETEKFSIARAVQRCPKCHYVSFDVSKNFLIDKTILTTPEYNEILDNNLLPESVNNYLAIGYVYEKQDEFYHSSHAYLCASWLLESIGKLKDSKSLLEKSAFCMLQYINSKSFKASPDMSAFACAVDVLRQIDKFDNAIKLANFAIKRTKSAAEKNILEYELLLCSEKIAQSKEIPEYVDNPTTLTQIISDFLKAENDDNLRKLRIFNQTRDFFSKCVITELNEGVNLVEDMSSNVNFSPKQLELLKEIVLNGVENYSKNEEFSDKKDDNSLNTTVIYKISNEVESNENIVEKEYENFDDIVESPTVKEDKNLNIVYLDEEFEEVKDIEEIEGIETIEPIDEVEESAELEPTDEVEESAELEPTAEVEESAELEPTDEVEESAELGSTDEVEESAELEPTDEVEETAELEPTDEVEESAELEPTDEVEESAELEPTDEVEETDESKTTINVDENVNQLSSDGENKDIILTLAKFDGKISIGEVQSLFECSYTKAKELLDEIVKEGKLKWTIDEEIYDFV